MIIGNCPTCEALTMNAIADRPLPCFQKCTCEECGQVYWLYHSRLDPEAYTQAEFDEKWIIGENGTISPRTQTEGAV